MKKFKLLTLALGSLLSVTACGSSGIIHVVDQELSGKLPNSVVQIKFWHCLGMEKTKNLVKVRDAFNLKYAGHYELVLEQPGGSGYSGLHEKIKTQIANGVVPALAMGYPDSFAEYMNTKEADSNILRITDWMNDTRTITTNKLVKTDTGWEVEKDAQGKPVTEQTMLGFTKAEKDDFVQAYLNEGKGYQLKGKTADVDGFWSVPMYKSTEVMFYNYDYFMGNSDINKVIFADNNDFWDLIEGNSSKNIKPLSYYKPYYGVKHDEYKARLQEIKEFCQAHGGKTYEVPTTWSEMISLSQTMMADRNYYHNIDPDTVASTDNFYGVGYDSDSNLVISQFAQRGIPYTSNDNIRQKTDHILFNNERAAKFLDNANPAEGEELGLIQLINNHTLCTKYVLAQDGSKYTNDKFTAGECMMSIGSTGGSDYQVTENFAVEVAPVPYSGDTPMYVQQGPSICFFDNNENPDINLGAWLFYKLMCDPDMNTALATENSYDPVRQSSVQSDEYTKFISKAKLALLNYVPTVTHKDQIYLNQFTSPVFFGSSKCREEIGNVIKYMFHNEKTGVQALQMAFEAARNATRM